ncbi:UvrB/UvrC motif-containing protein [Salisediminibacterium halotolerans]|uniref:Protein arginine kinase activator n=1 Tax=Salisediminibacterium halotolerans TaxID=517425 RepID=A0A1H9URZ3_9BACI|nr:UvrB/UvrC motif-containing protein [Salisediminibacterium haloalkalitolerans]SES12182.1 protein arginine kinase activator [Salisediminibacterium haloalkalitolerans]
MLCQECNEHPATLHFTKIVNGEKIEYHICETCAKEKGEHIPGSNSFSIHQLLSGLLDMEPSLKGVKQSSAETGKKAEEPLSCPHCGLTYAQFAEMGRFGCARCYEAFDSKLDSIFRRIHGGNDTHLGKIPKRGGQDLHVHREIEQLREQMKKQIEEEEFEKAAEVRDKIRSLQEQLERKGAE